MPLDPKLLKFTTASPKVVNFSFQEFASGQSFITFNGFNTINDTTKSYALNSNVLFSDSLLTTSAAFSDTSFAEQLNIDLDTSPFDLAITVKGTAYVNIPIVVNAIGAGDASGFAIVQLFHFDGTTETQMGADQQTGTLLETTTGVASSRVACLQFDITSGQHFNEGDLLRVTIKVSGKVTANTGAVGFYHDPKDRTATETGTEKTPTTKLEVFIPFEAE